MQEELGASKRMKIGQVLLFYPPVIGGIEAFVQELSKGLVKRGHDVHVFTLMSKSGKLLGAGSEVKDGVVIHRVAPWLDLSYRIKLWPSLVREINETRLQVVHAYCQGHFHTLATAFACRMGQRIPMVITTYGPLTVQAEYRPLERALLSAYDSLVTPFLFRTSDVVVARNPGITPWIRRMGIGPMNMAETPFGIPSQFLEPNGNGNLAKTQLGLDEKSVVLYLGRISQQKGLEYLVRAIPTVVKHSPDCIFVLAGPDDGFMSRLVELASSLGVEDRVRFEGPVLGVGNELMFYDCCDLFVMPSSFEGFGQAVAKAMARGKPVVASAVGALPFLIQDGDNGRLVRYGDERSLARAIIGLLNSREMSKRLGATARETVRDFRFENVIDEVEHIYQRATRTQPVS